MTPAGLLDDLLEADRAPLVEWRPGQPRDSRGRFEKILGSLKHGEHVELHDGITVKRSGSGLHVDQGGYGFPASTVRSPVATPKEAADQVVGIRRRAMTHSVSDRYAFRVKRRGKLKEGEAEFAWVMLKLTEEGLWVHPLEESAKTAGYSVTHAPRGKGGTNWITKSKPGNTGQLPAYIQNVRNGIARTTKDMSRATAIAIGKVRDWASGKGNVGPEVKAAAAKAIAQWEAMRAKAKGKVKEEALEESDDADFDYAALLAQIRAQPKVIPYAPRIFSFPGLGAHSSYPDGEGANNIVEAFVTATPKPKKPKAATTSSSSGTTTTSRERWAKWETAHEGQQGGVVQGVQARVGVKTDGQFGAKTKAAVVKFQKSNGLKVDGVVGRQTFAALAGHKNAASVKVGKLSSNQAQQLANFSKHGGTLMTKSAARKRSKRLANSAALAGQFGKVLKAELEEADSAEEVLALMLVEAERATHAEFPGRVKSLKQGEVARTPDGTAVRRISTQDGRDVFQVGSPRTYGETPGEVSYYSDHHRKAEDAIRSAHERSARSRDPESLGGADSYYRHDSVLHGGKGTVFRGVDAQGNALVQSGRGEKAVPFAELSKAAKSTGGGLFEENLLESAPEVADRFTPFS